jgi:hypothetical protein
MKKILLICFIAFSCSLKQKTTSIFQIENCDVKKMKREMMGVVTRYNPVQIDLNQTINSDTNFLDFITNVDTNCLVNNADFDTFSIRVLTKLQANHLARYHQNFDLLPMRKKYGMLIIDAFCRICKIDPDKEEFLNFDFYREKEKLDSRFK